MGIEELALIRPGGPGGIEVAPARLSRRAGVLLGLEGELPVTSRGELVYLAASEGEARLGASAVLEARHGDLAWFRLRAGFAPALEVVVRSVLGQSRQPARAYHVALDGMVVEVPAKPGGNSVEVAAEWEGYGALLAGQIEGHTAACGACWLALRFIELDPAPRAFLRNLVAGQAARLAS